MESSHSKEKLLVKNTLIYTVSNFGSKILTFLIVPLYTYYLTTSEFGTYDTIVSIINLVAPMCVLAIHEGMLRWLLKSAASPEEIICTGMGIYILFIVTTDIVTMLILQLNKWMFSGIFVFLLTMNTLHTIMQFMARGLRKNKEFAISGVIYTIIMLVLNICFVVVFRLGVAGMLCSMILAHVCDITYLFLCLRKELNIKKIRFNSMLAKEMMKYSIMLVPNNISWWIMNASDRVMLTAMVGNQATGIYSLACKFPSIVTIIHTLFYQAWQEQAVLEYDSENRDTFYTKVFNTYMKLASCMVLVLIPFSKFVIVHFMDGSYMGAYQYIGVLYIASLFSSFSGFLGTGYISAKDTKSATSTTVIGAVINIIINMIFIKLIGIWAACISTLVGYLVVLGMRIIQTKKYFTLCIEWKIFSFMLILNTIYSVIICFGDDFQMCVMFGVAMLITIIVNRDVIKNVWYVFKKRVKYYEGNEMS